MNSTDSKDLRVSHDDGRVSKDADRANVHAPDSEIYVEALERYPNDEAIDATEEKRLVRRLDLHILPLLGICYFFYVCF